MMSGSVVSVPDGLGDGFGEGFGVSRGEGFGVGRGEGFGVGRGAGFGTAAGSAVVEGTVGGSGAPLAWVLVVLTAFLPFPAFVSSCGGSFGG